VEIPVELIRRLPKTDLHVHVDGSLRPATLLELGRAAGVTLPFATPAEVDSYIAAHATPDLARYLEVFDLTLSVMQTREALRRTAFELAGIRTIGPEMSLRLADLTISFKGRGVVGFDLAGAEKDYPAKDHREAFYRIRKNNISGTVHAGEEFGPPSIQQALHYCGAHRIGHGTRLWEDTDLMSYVNDHRIPLEICLTSNVQVGASTLSEHPFRLYFDKGLRVTLNTDNRLISSTTVTQELDLACRTFGLDVYDLRRILIHGFKSAFLPYAEKTALLRSAVEAMDRLFEEYFPGTYRRLRAFL
jgi:adenosine deaminase